MKSIISAGFAFATLLSGPALAQETIKIGVIQPLTGSVAYNGTADVAGTKLAIEERNAKGGVLGKKVEAIIEDGGCKPADSVNAAEKLIQRDKVVALSGAFCSSATIAVMPVAETNKIPLVTGVSSKSDMTEKGNKWFFRATETDGLLAQSFAKILAEQLKLKKIAYIGVNDDFGRGGVEEFEKRMTALGATTVMKEYFDHGTTDFYTLLTKLRSSGADGVFVAAETQDGSIFVKQKAEFGLDQKVFGVGSWATADFMRLAGPAAEGIYAAVPYAFTMQTPKNQDFVTKLRSGQQGKAGQIRRRRIQRAEHHHGCDPARGFNRSGEDPRSARPRPIMKDRTGRFKFDAKGQAHGFNIVLVQLTNNVPKVVATTSIGE